MISGKISVGGALAMTVVLVWLSASIPTVKAQPACAESLIPCASFLNSTAKPTANCCQPLENAIKTQKDCLCNIYNNTALLKTFQINITRALQLPKDCGFPSSETNICSSSSATPTASEPPPPPGNNSAVRAAWSGYSGVLFLSVASLMLCWET
ncbi:hypothetical protein Ancab_032507 [Ancistrocladus abbreviatus]